MHNQQPPGVVQNWSTLQCSKHNTEQCGYDHAPVTRGRMRTQFPLPHGPRGLRPTVSWGGSWRPEPRGRPPREAIQWLHDNPAPPCQMPTAVAQWGSSGSQFSTSYPKVQSRNHPDYTEPKLPTHLSGPLQTKPAKPPPLQISKADDAIPLIYTDGSSAVEGHAGRLAGYGIFCEKQVSIAAFVPDDYRQTNNSAELLAVIRALRIFGTGDFAICTDSQYVVLVATGAARRWRLRGWIGLCGLVSNVPLWEQLLAARDENPRTVHWVKVPPPPCNSYALVIATVGVGTVLIWYLILIQYKCSAAA